MKKIQKNLYLCFMVLFSASFACVLVLFTKHIKTRLTFRATLPFVFGLILYFTLSGLEKIGGGKKHYLKIQIISLLTIFALLAVVMIYNCINNVYVPKKGDYEAIFTGIKEIETYGYLTDSNIYFVRHQHQVFTLFFYSVINRIFLMLGSDIAVNPLWTSFVNTAMIIRGGILLTAAVRLLADYKASLIATISFALFNSYWDCAKFIYAHVLSVFFVCLLIFSAALYFKKSKGSNSLPFLIFAGLCTGVAASAEGIITISVIAFLIFLILKCKNPNDMALKLICYFASFVISISAVKAVYKGFDFIDYTEEDRYQMPITHWIMMGATPEGIYNEGDYQATTSLHSKAEKTRYNISVIKQRLSSYTPAAMAKHLCSKISLVWCGATYGNGLSFIDNHNYNLLYRFTLFLIIFIGNISTIIRLFKNENFEIDFIAFLQIYLQGVFLFNFIWEARPLYLFSSLPFAIALASLNICSFRSKNEQDI